jgi:hypothetical protein
MPEPTPGRVCSGDDSCTVPSHWPDPAHSGPHRGSAEACAMPDVDGRGLSPDEDEMEPLDWLLNFVNAHDHRVFSHYFHMVDGEHRTCGCPLEGEDDAR